MLSSVNRRGQVVALLAGRSRAVVSLLCRYMHVPQACKAQAVFKNTLRWPHGEHVAYVGSGRTEQMPSMVNARTGTNIFECPTFVGLIILGRILIRYRVGQPQTMG